MMYMFTAKSTEWLDFRKERVSATEAASLVGVNSYLTANKLLTQKRSGDNDFIDNEHIWDGYVAEPAIFKMLELMGWDIDGLAPRGHVLVFEKDGLCSTPDNFRWDVRAVVEAKKTLKHNFEKNWMGTCPPLRYLSQVQVQMHTTGMDKAFLVCTTFEDNIPLAVYEVDYMPPYIELLKESLFEFRKLLHQDKAKLVKTTKEKQFATDLLLGTYTFLGLFRRGKKVDLTETPSVEDIFT